jgi:murein tripeptide amidase MpaA
VQISQQFDSGNIDVIACEQASDIRLEIRKDFESEFYQWFYFRLTGAKNTECTIKILNAGGAAYPGGFENYRICYSYDRENWLRHSTSLDGEILIIKFTPEQDSIYFSYFAPYSMERHADLIARSLQSPRCSHQLLGKTLDGQDLDLLKVSLTDGSLEDMESVESVEKKNCWLIARQHPGETMAQWWMEGCLERLLDESNEQSRSLLTKCNVFLVPNMNPDGSLRGHLRTNAAGRNLNREWAEPSLETSPEVFLVKRAMDECGVDFFLDVHGDETIPYCFIAGAEGLSDWNQNRQEQLDFYKGKLAELNSDFQTKEGYPAKRPGQANLTMSTAQTGQNHGCLVMTLEMPFKDTAATPDEKFGWSPARSKRLAHSCLDTLSLYLDSGLL